MTGIPGVQRSLDDERRPHPLLLGLLALLILLLVVVWIRYDPIERGGVGTCPEGSHEVPIGSPGEPGGDELVCSVANRDTTTVEFSTTAFNGGLLPVRITDVALRGEFEGVLAVDEILMWPANNQRGDIDSGLVPFETFGLGVGDERLVWIRTSIPACEDTPRDRVLLFRELPLRASVLGLPRDSSVALEPAVRVIVERC